MVTPRCAGGAPPPVMRPQAIGGLGVPEVAALQAAPARRVPAARDVTCFIIGVAASSLAHHLVWWLRRERRAAAAAAARPPPPAAARAAAAPPPPPPPPPAAAAAAPETATAAAAEVLLVPIEDEPTDPLVLERPLVTFDLETTGLDTGRDRVVEIAAVKLMPDGQVVIKGPQRIKPGIHIPAAITEIHGIRDEDVADAPAFKDVAQEWADFLAGCDLHGYNAKRFDIPMLRSEFRRVGIHTALPLGVPVLDSFRVFTHFEQRNLSSALRYFCGKRLEKAHSALADALAAHDVLLAQVARYPALPRSTRQLARWCSLTKMKEGDATWDSRLRWVGEELVFGFGKHMHKPVRTVLETAKDYLLWMQGEDFSDEVLIMIALVLNGKLPSTRAEVEAMMADGSWEAALQPEPMVHTWAVPS